jgi:hypothetical protein
VPGGQHSSSGGMSTQPNGTSGAGAATGSSGTYSRQSTGGGAESMSAKERSEIRSAVDKLHVAVVRPSFMVVTGFAVPNSLTLHPLPTEVTDIVPAYENYKFFRTSKTVVIVDPDTRQIVEIVG